MRTALVLLLLGGLLCAQEDELAAALKDPRGVSMNRPLCRVGPMLR